MTDLIDEMLNRMVDEKRNKLKTWNINTLRRFDKSNKRKNLRFATRDNQLKILLNFSITVNKTFNQIIRSNVNNYFDNLDLSPSTIEQRRIVVTKFFKWHYDIENPTLLKDLHPDKEAYNKIIKPSELLADEEIKKLILVSDNSRDKAFIATLADSGARIGEILSMEFKDANFEGDTCFIFLPDSKTQRRRVGLTYSTPYLQSWLDNYPANLKNPDAPLWIALSPKSYGHRLTDSASYEILQKLKRRSGIKKKINHHLFRHSCLSKCRKAGLSDVFSRRRHGLAPGSKVIERYTHIDDEETHNGYLKAMGYEPKKPIREDPEILKPKKCFRCGSSNPVTAKYCNKCYCSLDYEAVERDLNLLELFKTRFTELEGINVDRMLVNYRHLKTETSYMEKLFDCFNGNNEVKISEVRRQLGLRDDDALELLQYLVTAEQITFDKDMIYLKDKEEFKKFISMQKRYISFNSD